MHFNQNVSILTSNSSVLRSFDDHGMPYDTNGLVHVIQRTNCVAHDQSDAVELPKRVANTPVNLSCVALQCLERLKCRANRFGGFGD